MATICLHIGRLEEARRAHELAQRSNPKSKSLNLVMFYLYSGDFARMREEADAYVRGGPGPGYGLSTQAAVFLYNGELDVAERHLAAALRQVPDEPLLISSQGMRTHGAAERMRLWSASDGPSSPRAPSATLTTRITK